MATKKYQWKSSIGYLPAGHVPIPPHEAYNTLQAIQKKRGAVSASIVVEESVEKAKNKPTGQLHGMFEWDDAKAANYQREETARLIIRSIEIVYKKTKDSKPVVGRALVSVTNREEIAPEGKIYIPTTVAMRKADTREEVLQRALDEITKWRRTYAHLSELAKIFSVIDKESAA